MGQKANGSYLTPARPRRALTKEEHVASASKDLTDRSRPGTALPDGDVGLRARRRPGGRAPTIVVIAVGLGGVIGALTRYALALAMPAGTGMFPWGTFVVNLSGSAVLGFLLIFLIERSPSGRLARPLIGTGVIGAYTTFSTYVVEAVRLIQHGHVPIALTYLIGSALGGLLAVWSGMTGARLALRAQRRLQAGL